MKNVGGLLRLLRFELPLSAAICVVMGQMLALGAFAPIVETLSGALSIFLVSASILVLNDYFDVDTDRINAPHRPIPSGIVSPREALAFSIALLAGGLILSVLMSLPAFVCMIAVSLVGFLYNRHFKKKGLMGNGMVSVSVGMTFIYGGITVGQFFHPAVWFFGVIAALIDLGEEIAADAMDMQGDRLIDSQSLAITYGRTAALRTSGGIFLVVVLLTCLPFILKWFPAIYAIPIVLMDIAIAYPSWKLLTSNDEEGRKYIRWIYLGATAGLVVFIIMRLFDV